MTNTRANPSYLSLLTNIYSGSSIKSKDVTVHEHHITQYLCKLGLLKVDSNGYYKFTKLGKKFGQKYFKQANKNQNSKLTNILYGYPIFSAILLMLMYLIIVIILLPVTSMFIAIPQKWQMAIIALSAPIFVLSAVVLQSDNVDNNEFTNQDLDQFLKNNLNSNKYKSIQNSKDYKMFKLLLFTQPQD